MAIDFTGFFTQFGHGVYACRELLADIGGVQDTAIQNLVDAFDSESLDLKRSIDRTIAQHRSMQASVGGSAVALLRSMASRALVEYVYDDTSIRMSVADAIAELDDQMIANSQSLDQSIVSVSPSYGGSNVGDGKTITTVKTRGGLNRELLFAETITAEVTSKTETQSVWRVRGESAVSTTSYEWPAGSSVSYSLTTVRPDSSSNLVGNARFSDADAVATTLPDLWIPVDSSGVALTSVLTQSVVISGTPTGGWYTITLVDRLGRSYTTDPLSYDAGESDVQTAIQGLTGFSTCTVATTGTTPDFTHTISFVGVPDPGTPSVNDQVTGGAGAVNVSAYSPPSVPPVTGGRTLQITGDGSSTPSLEIPVAVGAFTQYAFSAMIQKTSISAGVLTAALVDSVGGTVLTDEEGASQSFTVTISGIGTGWYHFTGTFRTPKSLPPEVFLRLKATTAITLAGVLDIDHVILVPIRESYTGGPGILITEGETPWEIGDTITYTVANNYGGELLQWMDRIFNLRGQGRKLPTSGSAAQADSLIA